MCRTPNARRSSSCTSTSAGRALPALASNARADVIQPLTACRVVRCGRVQLFLRNEGHGAAPAGAGAGDLDRQAGNKKAVRARKLVEVGQFFDLAVFAGEAGEVRRPDVASIAGAAVV